MMGIAITGLVLSTVAIALVVLVEWLKRPRIEISARHWQATLPVDWSFAAVEVRNRPMWAPLRFFLVRQPAQGCEVTLEFRRQGEPALALPVVGGRWSGQPEPIRSQPYFNALSAAVTFVTHYDPSMVPQSLRMDVPAVDGGQEVAIAVQRRDGTSHAWGAESYAYERWNNPAWVLEPKTMYEVTVRVTTSGMSSERRFLLDNLAPPDFAAFSALKAL